ncbi:hypothetical protein E3N88_41821 [Mikania micrantha]|uniref:Uncharacterized protein n=1 Tax=Mikania micrantha TaxID=192012 RepID=A0A5N6LJJ3_9ASTR|nr:hypothetical protein E3N88_41821 [Mikania micrantha]
MEVAAVSGGRNDGVERAVVAGGDGDDEGRSVVVSTLIFQQVNFASLFLRHHHCHHQPPQIIFVASIGRWYVPMMMVMKADLCIRLLDLKALSEIIGHFSLVAMMISKLFRKFIKMAWQGWWMIHEDGLARTVDGRFKPATCLAATFFGTLSLSKSRLPKMMTMCMTQIYPNKRPVVRVATDDDETALKEAEANKLMLTPQFLELKFVETISNNTKMFFGNKIPSMVLDQRLLGNFLQELEGRKNLEA